MLLPKKIFHLLNFLKNKKKTIFFLTYLMFYNLKTFSDFFLIYLNLFNCFLKKKQSPFFLMTFKIDTLNSFFFNNILFKIFDLIKGIHSYFSFTYSSLKSTKKKYTVLRSPFVHKKSKEQFSFETFKGFFSLDLKKKNVFFIDYLECIWVKSLVFPFSFKILVKKIIRLRKNET